MAYSIVSKLFFSFSLLGGYMTEKQEKIIVTARSLFSEKGYKKVTMDEISHASGVTKRTIYRYFKNKDDLFRFFVLEKIEEIKEIVNRIYYEDLPIDQKTHKIIYNLVNYQKDERLIESLREEAMDLPLGVAKKCFDFITDAVILELKRILDDALEKKDIKPCNTQLLAFSIYKLYFALFFERKEKITENDINEIIDFLNSGLFRGDNNEQN